MPIEELMEEFKPQVTFKSTAFSALLVISKNSQKQILFFTNQTNLNIEGFFESGLDGRSQNNVSGD